MEEKPSKKSALIESVAEEIKKVSYLGAAGPYVILGEKDKDVVGGATLLAIALTWFIICQVVAHVLLALARKMEAEDHD